VDVVYKQNSAFICSKKPCDSSFKSDLVKEPNTPVYQSENLQRMACQSIVRQDTVIWDKMA